MELKKLMSYSQQDSIPGYTDFEILWSNEKYMWKNWLGEGFAGIPYFNFTPIAIVTSVTVAEDAELT